MASPERTASRAKFVLQEVAVDALVTAAILWVLVLLGEPLAAIITSPLFIVLMAGSLAFIAWKAYRHKPADADDARRHAMSRLTRALISAGIAIAVAGPKASSQRKPK